jgi:hypothetical protein
MRYRLAARRADFAQRARKSESILDLRIQRAPLVFKTTEYFRYRRNRGDRLRIRDEWIEVAIYHPIREVVQTDGRIRRWVYIDSERRFLRVVLLEDAVTAHNAFFDRGFPR